MKIKNISIPVIPLSDEIYARELRIVDHLNLTGSSPRNIGFIPITDLYLKDENALGIKVAVLNEGEVPTDEERDLLLSQDVLAYTYALLPLALYYAAEGYTLSARAYVPALPSGFTVAGFHAGIKAASKTRNLDMGLILSNEPCTWAGAFTKNAMKAVCVEGNQSLKDTLVQGVIVNSGNANCCTGNAGLQADADLRGLLKSLIRSELEGTVAEPEVLSASTGVIGRNLDLTYAKEIFLRRFQEKKNSKPYESIYDFARAILTTDLVPKITQDSKQRFLGIAKGSGMIAPNMATMLAFIITDLKIVDCNREESAVFMQKLLSEQVEATFNNISVDGDTSTNDMVLLLNNFSGAEVTKEEFKASLSEICLELCYQIIADGEGLTKIIDLSLENLPISSSNLQKIGRNIINSMLVKTAIFGSDPNWGRIVAAFAREEALLEGLEMKSIQVDILGHCVFKNATAQLSESELNILSKTLKHSRHVDIVIKSIDDGDVAEQTSSIRNSARFLGNDLSYDYVKINADYTT